MSKRETKLRTKQSTIIRPARKCLLTVSISTTFCLFIRCNKLALLNEILSMIMIQLIAENVMIKAN